MSGVPLVYDAADINAAIAAGSRIAGGSFGIVYAATMGTAKVAIKTVIDAGDGAARGTFQRELEVQGRVRHHRIVPVLGVCLCPLALVMPLMTGGDLADVVGKGRGEGGHLDPLARLRALVDIAEGLAFLHGLETPVVHGDLKPANILFDEDGRARLADAGIAMFVPSGSTHATVGAGRVAGTPGYLDPAAVEAGHVRPAQDIYAVGVMAYELITGERPGNPRTLERALRRLQADVTAHWDDAVWDDGFLPIATALTRAAVQCTATDLASRPDAVALFAELRRAETDVTRMASVPGVADATALAPEPFVRECVVCLDAARGTVLRPCSHSVMCVPCTEDIIAAGDSALCPFCRASIERFELGEFPSTYVPE
jgi:serine/threonine protein kinase